MGTLVTMRAVAGGADGYWWLFGGGGAAYGPVVTHRWGNPGVYTVTLSVAGQPQPTTHTITVTPVGPSERRIVLPTLFDLTTALVQSDDFYLYNPGPTTLDVSLSVRLESDNGDPTPQQVVAHVPAYATFAVTDLAGSTLNVGQASGFLTLSSPVSQPDPVVASFYNSGRKTTRLFGATADSFGFDGLVLTPTGPVPPVHVIGLNDTPDRLSTFGVTNATALPVFFKVRVLDHDGNLLGQTADTYLDRYSQTSYVPVEIRQVVGVQGKTDYRIEVSTSVGVPVTPFATDLRIAVADRDFPRPSTPASRVYLLGVADTAAKTGVQTDLLLANSGDQPLGVTLAWTKAAGVTTAATATAGATVAPRATLRSVNVLASVLGVRGGVGVLTITAVSGSNPLVAADGYDNTNPRKRYGQRIPALSDGDAAAVGQRLVLMPLRQDGASKTTVWLFNPGSTAGSVDLVYRGLDGSVLGTLPGLPLGAGQAVQLDPTQHPLAKTGVPGGFTLEVVVRAGKALAAAQVVRTATGDPAYVTAAVR
jgi:hypothetical protein